jgi:hypothetical protein
MVNENENKPKFNSAIGYVNRIDALFWLCVNSSTSLDSFGWFHALAALLREFSDVIPPNEYDKYANTIKAIGQRVNSLIMHQERQSNNLFPMDLFWQMNAFETDLRKVWNKSGLKMTYDEDALGGEEEW